MLKLSLLNLFLAVSSNLFAQSYILNNKTLDMFYQDQHISNIMSESRFVLHYSNIEGSPYLDKSFLDGYIIISDQDTVKGRFRYNIYDDDIEFEHDKKSLKITYNGKYKVFKIGPYKLLYQQYNKNDETKRGYMICLIEGKATLLQKKSVRFNAAEAAKPYEEAKSARFEPNEDAYYLSLKNKPAIIISNYKNLLTSFPELKPILKSYEGNRKLKNLNQIIDLVNFINTNYKE